MKNPPPSILLVDDNKVIRNSIAAILIENGFQISQAENGREAVEKALDENFDLILMDLIMPEMDGFQALRQLRLNEKTRRLPVLVLTSLQDKESFQKAFECGAQDFIQKSPFNENEFLIRVNSYVKYSLLNKEYILSTVNPETKLPNRTAFHMHLKKMKSPFLFLYRIYNLGSIIQFYGDSLRPVIEKKSAEFFLSTLPAHIIQYAKIFHMSQGTFCILFENEESGLTRENILKYWDEHFPLISSKIINLGENECDIDFSISFTYGHENLLANAELALSYAIRNKINYLFADDYVKEAYQVVENNIHWMKKIKTALAQDKIVPYFQPIINNRTGEIEKYEVLARLIDEGGNVIAAEDFIQIAKESKYYPDITKIIFLKAMAIFKNRLEMMSINISFIDIERQDIREFISEQLKKNKKLIPRIIFELVEEEGIHNFELVKDFILEMKNYGVKIAIDDFGNGYSNFKRMLELDADYIKIDGSLIQHIVTNEKNVHVVFAITSLAKMSNQKVIAEFVENEMIFKRIKEMGIDYSQGYFIGEPKPLS
jgi:EAL domain-containing protein (putative c-di-GMP-specific phosphodiesterase class I)/DNA-binding NarL/FixJ family response regulator